MKSLIPDSATVVPDPTHTEKYLSFKVSMDRLRQSLQATPDELAAWIFLGPDHGGIAAFRNANELDPPPRFYFDPDMGEDYLSPLMDCWFSEEDIDSFEPGERFITGAHLVERWSEQTDITVEAFIKARIAEDRLAEFHPTLGGTQATCPEDSFLPSLSSGLFSLTYIQAVEAEEFGHVLMRKSKDEPPAQRAIRIMRRVDELKRVGVRAFIKQVAAEEERSEGRIKELVKRGRALIETKPNRVPKGSKTRQWGRID